MENHKGSKKLLKFSLIYKILMNLLGAKKASKWIYYNFLKIKSANKIIDIGCGPGSFWTNYSELIPQDLDYHGLDPHEGYINTAKRLYKNKGAFYLGTTSTLFNNENFKEADIIICSGVLHHLSDIEVTDLISFSFKNLKSNGRFLAIEPVHLLKEYYISTWFMNQDRGMHIRNEHGWKELLVHPDMVFNTTIINNLINIPYNYILIEGISY